MSDPTVSTTAVLKRATELIEERGWAYDGWGPAGGMCIKYAITAAVEELLGYPLQEWWYPTKRAAFKQVSDAIGVDLGGIANWERWQKGKDQDRGDCIDRTQDEVLELLRGIWEGEAA